MAPRRGIRLAARLCVYLLALAFLAYPPPTPGHRDVGDAGAATVRVTEEPDASRSFSLVKVAIAGVLLLGLVGEVAGRRASWR